MLMKIEIIETLAITTYVGIRANATMTDLGKGVSDAFSELSSRRDEIANIARANMTYGITPPNYKGNNGLLDFYCCYEVEPFTHLPHGMIHIQLLPRVYSKTHYIGPISKTASAYDFTTKWLNENGYMYDDVSYYYEEYDEQKNKDKDSENSEVLIYCPVKRRDTVNKS